MRIELKPLQESDIDRFSTEMQEAFQLAVDEADGKMPLPVLPREDIEETLARPHAEALVAWLDGMLVGGAVVFANRKTREYECALLYVVATAHGKGIGSSLWQAIEEYYPEALAWTLCTPYFEIRNIYFYLRKCGFHIVDIEKDPDCASGGLHEGHEYMFTFVKRLDGKWSDASHKRDLHDHSS